MAQLVALFWGWIGQWLESRGMGAVAVNCYLLAGNRAGKQGAKALWRLGSILSASGQLQGALDAYRKSVEHDPGNLLAWCDLGGAYRQSRQFEEARRCYNQALALDPQNLLVLTRIGELHLAEGNAGAALDNFERVLNHTPLFFDALVTRIAALAELDRLDEAESAARLAVEHFPESAVCHINLASVLAQSGDKGLALVAYNEALAIEPDNQEALFNQAILQNDAKTLRNCEEFIRRQIELKGESANLLTLLAVALQYDGQLAEAETVARRLIESHPTHPAGWQALASCCHDKGDAAAALECYRKTLELNPKSADMLSAIAFCATYLTEKTSASVFQTHLDWAERFEAPLLEKQFTHPPGNEVNKRLRIGYVSGDFFTHPVGLLLRGVMQQHDHGKFEIHCFATRNLSASDQTVKRLHDTSDAWHEVQTLSNEELAELIRAQAIDILVDLSGHTDHNRLKVFALKPAPVQATWLGYFHSTGLTSIDYFISDRHTTPRPEQQFFSEIPVRLPHSRFCFAPFDGVPPVAESPFIETGHITFGSFNRLAKLTEPVIAAWARIVLQVPGARLLIKDRGLIDEETAGQLTKRLAAHGLSAERLVLRSVSQYAQMYEEYSDIDIALDPFPFNGGMTTLDALWMGVPVVALAGISVVSRQSASILNNLSLEELIFSDVDSYVAGATALALDGERLAELRRVIRPRMSRSPLCDAEQFTADLEMLYRRMWQAWCRGEKLGPEIVSGIPVARKITGSMGCSRTDGDHLVELFQKRWWNNSSESSSDLRSDSPSVTQEKIEVISATRLSESEFWNKSALGISLRRLAKDTRLVARIAFENQRGLPDVFNARIDSSDSHEILLFIHDDVWIDDCFLADHVIDGLNSFDMIGVAGNRRRLPNQPAWLFIDDKLTWDTYNLSGRVAHDRHPFGTVSVYGAVPAECELLDGVFLAARKSRLRSAKVQFDPRFNFHFYDMDFCRSARANGLRLGTWPISLTHQSGGAFGKPDWKEQYGLYQEKWE